MSQPAASAGGLVFQDIQQIGGRLFTKYAYPFEITSVLLLVAMIGAIVLTLRHRADVKRQEIRPVYITDDFSISRHTKEYVRVDKGMGCELFKFKPHGVSQCGNIFKIAG